MYDYLVVGAGLYGAVFAQQAKAHGKSVLVIDKRDHIAGNVYSKKIEGIEVHQYGAHIFHTNDAQVWNYVNQFAAFNRFTNSPVANYKGKLYSLPFNMYTFNQMWGVTTPEEAQAKIDEQKAEAVAKMKADGVSEPRNLEEQAQVLIGKDIYERLIKGYTEKQWGRKCTDLPAFIIKRLPVRLIFDNNYFNDKYQGIPVGGYNKLIDGLLEGIDTMTSVDFFADNIQKLAENKESSQKAGLIKDCWQEIAEKLVFTGKIDQFYDYQFGKLNYRTVRFEQEIIDSPNYQGNAVVNYTEQEVPYTRVIEHKHFEMFGAEVYNCPKTVISKEYSTEWKDGMEPYYPVNDKENSELYAQYKNLADQEKDVIFGGRLAEYKYYDMAPIIEKALAMFK